MLDDLAADDAILTCDSGTIATWAARHWTIRGDRQFYLSGNLATMAPGLPYALGIQHAFPGRQVIAYVGDGGFAMLMAEFLTAVRDELPIKVVVNNNNSLGQILWEQMVLGYPEHGVRFHQPGPTSRPGPPRAVDTGRRSPSPASSKAAPSGRAGSRRPGDRRHRRRPQRAADARQGHLRAGQRSSPRRSCKGQPHKAAIATT